jgi:uncharacterized protein (AIM24 family)
MAKFQVSEREGVFWVSASLTNETVRTEMGALSWMKGDITMESRAPSAGSFLKSMATGESVFRPTYTGSGELHLESSFAGFHVFSLGGATWILERGAYWASDGAVDIDVHRDSTMTSLMSGQGFVNFQTKASGTGQVVLTAQGPVEEMFIDNDRLVVDGTFVLAREASLRYSIRRATKSLFGSMSSGEGLVSTFEGTGRVLIAPVPYWRYRMFAGIAGAMSAASTSR